MKKSILLSACGVAYIVGALLPFYFPAVPENIAAWVMLGAGGVLALAVGVLSYGIGAARALDKMHKDILAQVTREIRAHNATAPEARRFALTDDNPMRHYYGGAE
jgi:hypothetical protein